MQTLKLKNPIFLLVFTFTVFIPVIGMIGCNGNNEQTSNTNAEPVQQEIVNPVIVADSLASVTVPSHPDDQQPGVIENPKKEIVPTDKKTGTPKKLPAEQPVAANTNPSVNKPVTAPVPDPVIKNPEPVKSIPGTPKPVEVPVKPPVVVTQPGQNSWIVPAKYKTMTSPSAADKESIALGKDLYGMHCRSCHGSKGEGDGTKAASLDTEMKSFLDAGFQAQKPGEVYYKSIIGRGDMPKFEKKIRDEDERWAIVHYIMSLKN